MSRHWYSYVGYGIFTDNWGKISKEGLSNLVSLCESDVQDNINKMIDNYIDDNYEEDENVDRSEILMKIIDEFSYDYCSYGVKSLFIAAIENQENISLVDGSTDSEECILFPPIYPWCSMSEQERALNEEKLDAIFKKYQLLLGIPEDKIERAEYQDVVGYC